MMNLEAGSLADWIGDIIAFLGILVASFFTIRYYHKDNRKTWKLYKNIEFKRISLEKGVEIVSEDKIIVISCYNNSKLPIFIEVNKVVRKKSICSKIVEEYPIWTTDLDIDKNKKIKIMPMEFTDIYKVDLELVLKFYQENKNKLKWCEEFYFYIEELEGKEEYIVLDDVFKE